MQNQKEDNRIALRDFIAWFIGSMIGAYFGFQLATFIEASIVLLAGILIGWIAGGFAGPLLLSILIRTPPKKTIAIRTASTAVFGLILGGFTGGFISSLTNLPQGICAIIGSLAGLIAGWRLGDALAKRSLDKQNAIDEKPTSSIS